MRNVALIPILLLAFGCTSPHANIVKEPDNVIAQADRLFVQMKAFDSELQSVTGQANYPDVKTKELGKSAVRDLEINIELSRIALARLDSERDRDSLIKFVTTACGVSPMTGGCEVVTVPSFEHYEGGTFEGSKYIPSKTATYANTARLESMHDDFLVLLKAMLQEAK